MLATLTVLGMHSIDALMSGSQAAPNNRTTNVAKCWTLANGLRAGEAVTLANVAETSCVDEQGRTIENNARLLRYDRSTERVVMRQDARSGEFLGRVVLKQPPVVQPSTIGTLVARVGAVVVLRDVDVHQSGEIGERVFVKLSDGEILSAVVSLLPTQRGNHLGIEKGAP